MKTDKSNISVNKLLAKVADNDLVVAEEISTMPVFNKDFITPVLGISICISGCAKLRYDMRDVEYRKGDISVTLPGHILHPYEISDDYRQIQILLSKDIQYEIYQGLGKSYLRSLREPCFRLNEEHFNNVLSAVRTLGIISKEKLPAKHEALVSMAITCANLISHYYNQEHPDETLHADHNIDVFARFYNMITMYYTESKEVNFYAEKMCLSPKYFSTTIRKTTGITASEWIANHVILRAKQMLIGHKNLSIQTISYQLGFTDQAIFSRYFKKNTGMSPTEYRHQN